MKSQQVGSSTIPGPAGHPLLGTAGDFKNDLLATLRSGFDQYGDVVEFRLGPSMLGRRVVAFFHPSAIGEIFANPATYGRDTASFRALGEMFGENLVTTEGSVWRQQRRALQPIFTPKYVERYASLMREEASRLLREGFIHTNGTLDLVPVLERYALRILSRTLFRGHDGVEEAIKKFERLVPLIGSRVRGRAGSLLHPPLSMPTPTTRRFLSLKQELYDTVDGILAQQHGTETDDLVGLIRSARDPETGAAPSLEDVRNQALIFLVSGHTTTSNAITFTLYLLGRHPEVQERVARSCGESPSAEGQFIPLRAAIREAMRLYPSAYALSRRCTNDTVLAGHRLSRGTDVMVSPWVTHRHPELWEDPDSFRPQRFEALSKPPRYTYFPFGGGPRVCIGEHLALLEATMLTSSLLQRYRVVSEDESLPLAQLVSLRPAAPVQTHWQFR